MKALKKIALAFLFCAVALQGYSAVAMPFCQHQPATEKAMASDNHAGHQHETSSTTFVCDDCTFCQLCAAPALPAVIAITVPNFAVAMNPETPNHFFLFVPEQPQPPPLSHPV